MTAIRAATESPLLDLESETGYQSIQMAFDKAPQAVAEGLLTRIQKGLALPLRCKEMVDGVAVRDDGPLVALVLDTDTEIKRAAAAARAIGPTTATALIGQYLEMHSQLIRSTPQTMRDRYWRLRELIGATQAAPFLSGILAHVDTPDASRRAALCELFAAHSRDEEGAPLAFDAAEFDRFSVHLSNWLVAAPSDADSTRGQWAQLARAASRVGAPALAEPLFGLLQADLVRWRSQREAFRMALAQGREGPPEARHSHVLQYGAAFAAIGTDAVVAMMESMLADEDFGVRAALVLRQVWTRQTGELPAGVVKETLSDWPNYAGVAIARIQRRSGERQATPLAAAMFATIERLCGRGEDAAHRRALELAVIALTMPHQQQDAVIEALMATPMPLRHKRGLLMARVLSGEVVAAETVMAGLEDLLVAAQTETWLLDDQHSDVDEWLELLAFSDRPMAVMDGIARVSRLIDRAPWRLRRLLKAIGHAPSAAEEMLFALADRAPRLLQEYAWGRTLLQIGSETAIIGLTERLLKADRVSSTLFTLGRELAKAASNRPSLRRWLIARYEQVGSGDAAGQLESILIQVPDGEIIKLLIGRYAATGRRFDGDLRHAIEEVVLKRVPIPDWQDAYELMGEPVAPLRKQLFAMTIEGGAQSALARRSLEFIDHVRDEHGRPYDEPRHPDISTGKPWPVAIVEDRDDLTG